MSAQRGRSLAGERVQLDAPQQPVEILAIDVEGLADIAQRGVDIGFGETDALRRRRVLRAMAVRRDLRAMRIAVAGKTMEGDAEQGQHQRIEPDRNEGEAEPIGRDGRPAERGGQRRGPARRMQAAQERHRRDRECDRASGRDRGLRHVAADEEADQGGDGVAADDRPGLRQRARRDREEQQG